MADAEKRSPSGEHSHSVENETLKPGAPPRPKTEPHGSQGSSRTSKTQTDPATGEPSQGRPGTAAGG